MKWYAPSYALIRTSIDPSSPTMTFGWPVHPVPHHSRGPCWSEEIEHMAPSAGYRQRIRGSCGTGPSPYQLRVAFPRNVVIPVKVVLIGPAVGVGLGVGLGVGEGVTDGDGRPPDVADGEGDGAAAAPPSFSNAPSCTATSAATARPATIGEDRERKAGSGGVPRPAAG